MGVTTKIDGGTPELEVAVLVVELQGKWDCVQLPPDFKASDGCLPNLLQTATWKTRDSSGSGWPSLESPASRHGRGEGDDLQNNRIYIPCRTKITTESIIAGGGLEGDRRHEQGTLTHLPQAAPYTKPP